MLAILIYVVDAARRTLRKITRAAALIADSFREAQRIRRTLPRVYMEE